jgi:hypothetical protein
MPGISLASTAIRFSAFVDTQTARDAQLRDWAAGTVDGGPAGDGYYPLTDSLGVTMLIPCVAKLSSLVSGPSVQASLDAAAAFALDADASQADAEAAATAAQAVLTTAQTKRDEAVNARNEAVNAAAAAAFEAQSIPGLLATLSALSERVRVLEETGVAPPVITFAPSLDFSDPRNSQYL